MGKQISEYCFLRLLKSIQLTIKKDNCSLCANANVKLSDFLFCRF
jgi:hypothetical protein